MKSRKKYGKTSKIKYMNTKTILSKFPKFMEDWKKYKKKFPGVREWYIASDYCLNKDSEKPTKVITFTLCPAVNLEWLQDQINRFLKSDVKNRKNFSDVEIQFIRDNGYFFSIVIIIKNVDLSLVDKLKQTLDSWIQQLEQGEKNGNSAERLKRFYKLNQYLNQKSYSADLVAKITLVACIVGMIAEFLVVKHGAQKLLWISDRGKVIDFKEGIVIELANINYHNLVNGRTGQKVLLGVAKEDSVTKRFDFDPMIRYPDIISGVFSSTDLDKNISTGQKHFDMFVNAIAGNKRIHSLIWSDGNLQEGYRINKLKNKKEIIRAASIKEEP